MIKEICSWLPPFYKHLFLFIQPRWQLRRTYFLITIPVGLNFVNKSSTFTKQHKCTKMSNKNHGVAACISFKHV